ncbi:alanine--tRNA ligase [Candidatus Sulfidibacterium hydrothermale]|uniref:alanine--tRNA ligase n=1 Tax=Candidatus Sulfidibacterium hydrothermale TaxID=2875962 RepID=UPI001F0B272D|nr:alanine--tRNA ligase [Candidatus Sulfidibacterium hydrothermale]UBM63459.1 alanine--tRNA ligase [Candidatus Sulfidibacterium hydrothermale]
MTSLEIRKKFLEFFQSKQHTIVPGAPIVVKDDPTLMFVNAGMNQFKDIFLGNAPAKHPRVANTQKCLRVSGKHNDLEEVGHDTYHHTLFEMLGNWSFGDYFKKEAIAYAWELLTEVYHINKDDLYVTYFGGDETENLSADEEAKAHWLQHIPEDHILPGSKKDNFWEMGETGPCGPCSEIHIDLRPADEKAKIPGKQLVNTDHPRVIEIWNLVFIEFNRLANGSLEPLPQKHIDTGMGFERLTMVLQGKTSNYDTDIFMPLIDFLANLSGEKYGTDSKKDVAMRVIADHLRAVAFTIADGQLPSNTGAGYVIRRILRRAVRYGFTFLHFDEPFLYKMLPVLVKQMGEIFPEIVSQEKLVSMVIKEEEEAFLRTLSQGLKRFEQYLEKHPDAKQIDGLFAFELFDTYGFPIDLTQLMAQEKGLTVDMEGFKKGLESQKNRSRKDAEKSADDWIVLLPEVNGTTFVGYTRLSCEARIVRYRKIQQKKQTFYEVVLDQTPFYAESGGQAGDTGVLVSDIETLHVVDVKNENNLRIHYVKEAPQYPNVVFQAQVDEKKRTLIANNHSATHLMHAALRRVLGTHVEQKGSFVDSHRLRFDFSHFSKMTEEEIKKVEQIVNAKIRENIPAKILQNVPIEEAKKMGAMALFGEKYGDKVRVVIYDPEYSVELCGGTHVPATGQIGCFKIISESGIAAGVRRIEAVTAETAEKYIDDQLEVLKKIKSNFKIQQNPVQAVEQLIQENNTLRKEVEKLQKEQARHLAAELLGKAEKVKDVLFLAQKTDTDPSQVKNLVLQLRATADNLVIVLAVENKGKVNLAVGISDALVKSGRYHAGEIIRKIAPMIKGGGGGQPHFAMAGGKDVSGIPQAFNAAKNLL